MKRLFSIQILLLSLLALTHAQPQPGTNKYFFVLLKRPSNAPQLSQEAGEKLQEEHMANIRKLHAEHKLLVAGPLKDETSIRGIFVFQADSVAQVQDWVATDPAVKAGHLAGEVHGPWLIDASAIHATDDGAQDMQQYTLVLMKRADKWKSDAVGFNFVVEQYPAFVKEMTAQGYLAIGGLFPLNVPGDLRAVAIFRVGTEQTSTLLKDDSTIKTGLMKPEIHPWITGKGVLAPGQPMQ